MGKEATGSIIIGRRCLFMRQYPRTDGNGFEKPVPYAGVVLDKIRSRDERLAVDFYLVQCDDGAVERFYPEELTNIIS